MRTRPKIGEILVRLQVLSSSDVKRVLEACDRRGGRAKFGQTARDMGLVTEEQILAALAVQMELLPNIDRLSLRQILDALATADVPA
jgi:hypothetical protein